VARKSIHLNNGLEVSLEPGRGLGLKVSHEIEKGTALGEYIGKPLMEEQFQKLRTTEYIIECKAINIYIQGYSGVKYGCFSKSFLRS
jgi:hypothetical protein